MGELTAVNGALYFTANAGELWKSDGTPDGTVPIKNLVFGDLTDVNGTLFFVGYDSAAPAPGSSPFYYLWKTDGTTLGTKQVKAWPDYCPLGLTAVNGLLFFVGYDSATGFELWKSDGTTAGTMLAQDINPGPGDSDPGLTNINGRLYLSANDGLHGWEPWVESSRQDNDLDGVSDAVEAAAPNGGDGNFDGIPDAQQLNVASLPNSADGSYITLAAPTGTTLVNVTAPPQPSPETAPTNVLFPIGYLDFTLTGVAPGGATTVVLYVASNVHVDTYWTYGPTPGNHAPHWYEFLYDGTTGAEIDNVNHRITLHFVDGQRGDSDLSANGRVVDPGAPAVHPKLVRIDGKPGDSTNSVNLATQGTISVAIFSSATFDATRTQIASVLFAGAHAFQYSLQDLDHDGRLDLVLQFRVQDTNLRDVYAQLLIDDKDADGVLDSTRQTARVALTGQTQSGQVFEGFDTLSLFLSGRELRKLLDDLAAAGLM